ncbi:MAG: Flp pilus assembly protein CpaB [Acidimicrobiales bacterium]
MGAIVIGVIAALLIYNYVQGIDDRANNNAKLVDVYVAKSDIPRGTAGEQAASSKAIDKSQIPQQFKPATAITTTAQLAKKVALFDIPANSVIVDNMFVDPASSQITFRQRLTNKSYVAVSVSTDNIHGVAGFLVAGDEVNMAIKEKFAKPPENWTGLKMDEVYQYLYQKVYIIAVGSNTVLAPGETTSTAAPAAGTSTADASVLTLEVPADAALWIMSGQEAGFYLSLTPKDYVPAAVPTPPFLVPTLPGEDPGQLTPYGPAGKPAS